jgi:hypothetical protein
MEYRPALRRRTISADDRLEEERAIAALEARRAAMKRDIYQKLKPLDLEIKARKSRIKRMLAMERASYDEIPDTDSLPEE